MRTANSILLIGTFLLAACTTPVRGAATKVEHVRLSGREYVHLGAWARANEFSVHWLRRGKILQISKRLARVVFTMNSRQAEISGVTVWLSFPLLYRNGRAYISQLDLEETLGPVLSPPRNAPGIKVKTICLDPGHGGKDPGYRVGSREEKKYTLLLAREVRTQLDRAGLKTVLTRTSDTYVGLAARPAIARKHKANLFVSLHFNSSESSRNRVEGVETYCLTPAGATSTNAHGKGDTRWVTGNQNDEKNMLLAYEVQKALVKQLNVEDRGVKRARFAVLRDARMPAILIEGGFLSNPVEGKKILDPGYRRRMARAIVNGILAYSRIVKR